MSSTLKDRPTNLPPHVMLKYRIVQAQVMMMHGSLYHTFILKFSDMLRPRNQGINNKKNVFQRLLLLQNCLNLLMLSDSLCIAM